MLPAASFDEELEALGARVHARSGEVCVYEPTLERVGGSLFVRRGYPRCATPERGAAFGFALRRGEATSSYPTLPLTTPLYLTFYTPSGEATTVLGFFDTRPSAASQAHVEYFQHLSVMGLRSLENGEAPPLGARLGTDTPAWDEPGHGVLRDWDMVRGFMVGGLGVTWRHVPNVALAAVLLVSVPTVLLCGAARACASWRGRQRRARHHPHEIVGSDPDAAPLVPPEFDGRNDE